VTFAASVYRSARRTTNTGIYDLRLRARPPLRPAAARRRRGEPRLEEREVCRRDLLLPFVSPLRRRVLFTVAAAIRFAVPLLRPRLFALRLMCSYCRSRLLLQELGMRFLQCYGPTRSARRQQSRLLRTPDVRKGRS